MVSQFCICSKNLYVGFSQPFCCILERWRSSGVTAASTCQERGQPGSHSCLIHSTPRVSPLYGHPLYFVPCVFGQKASSGSLFEQKMIMHQEQLCNLFYCCRTSKPADQSQQYQLWNLLSGLGSNSPNKKGGWHVPLPASPSLRDFFPPAYIYQYLYLGSIWSQKKKPTKKLKAVARGCLLLALCFQICRRCGGLETKN